MTNYKFSNQKKICIGCGKPQSTVAKVCWKCYKILESKTNSIKEMLDWIETKELLDVPNNPRKARVEGAEDSANC